MESTLNHEVSKTQSFDELLREFLEVWCTYFLIEAGGLAFLELIYSVKENRRRKILPLKSFEELDVLSLNQTLGSDTESTLEDFVAGKEKGPSEIVGQSINAQIIEEVLSELKPRTQSIISLRFGLRDNSQHSQQEVGKIFNCTMQNVGAIERSALRELRIKLHKRGLQFADF